MKFIAKSVKGPKRIKGIIVKGRVKSDQNFHSTIIEKKKDLNYVLQNRKVAPKPYNLAKATYELNSIPTEKVPKKSTLQSPLKNFRIKKEMRLVMTSPRIHKKQKNDSPIRFKRDDFKEKYDESCKAFKTYVQLIEDLCSLAAVKCQPDSKTIVSLRAGSIFPDDQKWLTQLNNKSLPLDKRIQNLRRNTLLLNIIHN